VKELLPTTEGLVKYRLAAVLYKLKDPAGRELLNDMLQMPTIAPEAAMLMARDGNWDAIQYLRKRLARPADSTPANILYKVRAAAAFVIAGDPQGVTLFQQMLQSDNPAQLALAWIAIMGTCRPNSMPI